MNDVDKKRYPLTDKQKKRKREWQKKWNDAHKELLAAKRKRYNDSHREKVSAYSKEYARTHAEERRVRRRKHYLMNKDKMKNARRKWQYGITEDEYKSLLKKQGGVCAICSRAGWPKKGPCVDHSHASGGVRGILCNQCNIAIGMIQEDPKIARAMANYLESHKP